MLRTPFKSTFARAAIFALVLAIAIPFVSGGLTPTAFAQTADAPCELDAKNKKVTCSYDENGTDPVADFSAMDPEGQGVEWALEGADAKHFTIDGGVLSFKKSPSFEPVANAKYDDLTVRATEVLDEDEDGPAQSSYLMVTVTIKNVDEPGKVTFNYLQPQVGVPWVAELSDPDNQTSATYEWSVPKVAEACA